jgi:hypothetical protein
MAPKHNRFIPGLVVTVVAIGCCGSPLAETPRRADQARGVAPIATAMRPNEMFGEVLAPAELAATTGQGTVVGEVTPDRYPGVRLWDEWSRRRSGDVPNMPGGAGQVFINGQRVR